MAVNTLLEHSTTLRRIFSPSPRQVSGDGQGERGPPLRPWANPWLPMCLFDHGRSKSYCSARKRFSPQWEMVDKQEGCEVIKTNDGEGALVD
jgi:hypothetical protein